MSIYAHAMTLGSRQRIPPAGCDSNGLLSHSSTTQSLRKDTSVQSFRGDNFVFLDDTMNESDQECALIRPLTGRPPRRSSVVLERAMTVGARLSSSNGNLVDVFSEYQQQVSHRNPIQYIQKKFTAFKRRRTDINMMAANDPEVTITREDDVMTDSTDEAHTHVNQPKCQCEFVFDPSSKVSYWWMLIVGCAVLYNLWVMIYRFTFDEIRKDSMQQWFLLDYFMDFIYFLDIAVGFRTGYLEEGVLQTTTIKLRVHYMNSMTFYIDCLCLLPLDILYLSIDFNSLLRAFRFIKIYKLWRFLDVTERHTNYPNLIRTISMLHYLLLMYHWNACIFYLVMNESSAFQKFPTSHNETSAADMLYVHSLYWSVLSLSTISNLPTPENKKEYAYCIITMIVALLLFAAVMGLVAHIVSSMNSARKDFQAKLDNVKTYMRQSNVPKHLQNRVIRWFDYLWHMKKNVNDTDTFGLLPDRLKAEINIHIHLDTLKKVDIFQNTEAGFLKELVLRLEPVLFSPGDHVCRKGEVGKEMYIVKKGKLNVVDAEDKVLATLQPGSYFGEISILNMGDVGNRRTASVKSVGYSDLFCLKKEELTDVLKDYPAARARLEDIAHSRLDNETSTEDNKDRRQQHRVRPFCFQTAAETSRVRQQRTGSISSTNSHSMEAMQQQPQQTGLRIPASSPCLSRKSSLGQGERPRSRKSSARSLSSDMTRSCRSSTVSISDPKRSLLRAQCSPIRIPPGSEPPREEQTDSEEQIEMQQTRFSLD